MIDNIYYKLTYYNFVKQSKAKQSKAKQSKAKPLLYLLNNSKFYISQFFRTFNFLSVFFCFAKNQFAILNNNVAHAVCLWQAHCVNNSEKSTQGVKTALLYNFLTLIRFNLDNLSMKIKNHCFVINKNYFIFLMELLCR